jgi:hypothetical protein
VRGAIRHLSLPQAREGLRGHRAIENRLSWVRDISFSEGRLPGRKGGPELGVIRNLALNLLRVLGCQFVGDGFRALSARADRGLSLLIG